MAKLNKASNNVVSQIYHERQHLKYPIPRSLEIRTVGHSLTEQEWNKFCKRHLTPKQQSCAERKLDGVVHFVKEYGLGAALELQEKFPRRFHFVMDCSSKESAALGLLMAQNLGLNISEIHFKNGRNEIVNMNDKALMERLIESAANLAQPFMHYS